MLSDCSGPEIPLHGKGKNPAFFLGAVYSEATAIVKI